MRNRFGLKERQPAEVKEEQTCKHYWVIDSASGPTSRGVCRFCGEVKEFQNSWSGSSYMGKDAQVFGLPKMLDDDEEED